MTLPALINLHPNEYGHEFHYYRFAVKLNRCDGSCNTFKDLSYSVPSKAEDLNLSMFNMIPEINESSILIKEILCEGKYRYDGKNVIHINGGITRNVDVSVENVMYVKKLYFESRYM